MQVGAENRTKLIAALVLMGLALALMGNWAFGYFGGSSTTAAAPAATSTAQVDEAATAASVTAPVRAPAHGKKTASSVKSLDPTLRYNLLRLSEDTEYKGAGRNIFAAQIEIPRPIVPPVPKPTPGPQLPPQPPPPPPIDLKFFGFASQPGEPKKIFLSKDGDTFIASEGDIVDRRYRVLRITPVSVEIEDVLNNNRQEIPLTQGAG